MKRYMPFRLVSFNPLFIRSVFLLGGKMAVCCMCREMFQSLIHQVSVSFLAQPNREGDSYHLVSIPYSSGQCFFSRSKDTNNGSTRLCFNPLFIRSVFLLRNLLPSKHLARSRFQSLIHQVSVSFSKKQNSKSNGVFLFQSLIHQVSVSFQG